MPFTGRKGGKMKTTICWALLIAGCAAPAKAPRCAEEECSVACQENAFEDGMCVENSCNCFTADDQVCDPVRCEAVCVEADFGVGRCVDGGAACACDGYVDPSCAPCGPETDDRDCDGVPEALSDGRGVQARECEFESSECFGEDLFSIYFDVRGAVGCATYHFWSEGQEWRYQGPEGYLVPIGLLSESSERYLCAGEDADFSYQDTLLDGTMWYHVVSYDDVGSPVQHGSVAVRAGVDSDVTLQLYPFQDEVCDPSE